MTGFFYRQMAKAAQLEDVNPGQMINLKVDLALAHDGSGPEILRLFRTGGRRIAACSRVLITLDHCFPAPTIEDRIFQRDIHHFAKENDIRLYEHGEGVLHQVVAEEESLWPGMIIIGSDGHVATAGAFGAIAFSVSPADFVEAVGEGVYRAAVPEQVVISVEGPLRPTVLARDLALHLAYRHGKELKNKAVLLTGSTVDALTVSEKMSLCNFLPESGVATALVLPQGERETIAIRVSGDEVGPMLVAPGNPGSMNCPAVWPPEKITVAIAGGCSSGRLDDMKIIAEVLAKNEVHPDVTFIITPGSKSVMGAMDKLEISSTLRNGGAVIMPPGCGPCPGKHFGLLCDDDTAITTTIRNNPGRIGAEHARIFLASPLTVALSAVNGVITQPGN